MSKISIYPKIESIFTVENQFIMEMRKFFTFVCHDSALLYAISVLIENILILYSTFPTLRDLFYCIEITEKHSLSRPESYLFLSKRLSLSFKKIT